MVLLPSSLSVQKLNTIPLSRCVNLSFLRVGGERGDGERLDPGELHVHQSRCLLHFPHGGSSSNSRTRTALSSCSINKFIDLTALVCNRDHDEHGDEREFERTTIWRHSGVRARPTYRFLHLLLRQILKWRCRFNK